MFLTYLRRELRRRRRQAIVVALGLALGIGLTVTVTAVSAGVKGAQQTVLHSLYGVGTDMSVTQQAAQGTGGPRRFDVNGQRRTQNNTQNKQSFTQDRVTPGAGLASLDAASVAKIARSPHVASAAGGLTLTDLKINGSFARGQSGNTGGSRGGQQGGAQQPGAQPSQPPINVDTYQISGVDLSVPGVGPLSSVDVTSGRTFTAADAKSDVVVLAATFAKQRSLAKGSSLTISGTKFTVVGLVSTATGSGGSDAYIPLAAAQKLANLTGKVTTVYVKATSASSIDAASTEVKKVLPKATVTTSSDLAGQISGSLSSASSLASNLGTWLSIAVLIAAFVMAVLFTISAVSRRVREFGTLKALGWRTRRIVGQVMGEALVQGVVGGVLGIGLGFLGAFLVNQFAPSLSATVGATGTTAQAGGAPGAGGRFGGGGFGGFARTAQHSVAVHLSASVTLTSVLLAVALAILGGLVAGLFGGWRAARLRPADALRRVD